MHIPWWSFVSVVFVVVMNGGLVTSVTLSVSLHFASVRRMTVLLFNYAIL
jgi:hypothetical protein